MEAMNPRILVDLFDSLKPSEVIEVAMSSVMGMSRADTGNYHPWKVGRRSRSKKYNYETITLVPLTGKKPPAHAAYKLWKRGDGERGISASHGDMGVFLKGIRRPAPGAVNILDLVDLPDAEPFPVFGERMEKIRWVVDNHQHHTVDGVMMDGFTASAIVQVHDALNETQQARFVTVDITRMVDMTWKLIQRCAQ